MNELMPALVGLFGVLIGGLIQVFFQGRQLKNARAREIREYVSEFVAVLDHYLVAIDSALEYMHREHPNGIDSKRKAEEAARVATIRTEVLSKSAKLVTIEDQRISDQTAVVTGLVGDLSSVLKKTFTDPQLQHRLAFDARRPEIKLEFNLLVAMVTPRVSEAFWRFRSREGANKYLDESAARRAAK